MTASKIDYFRLGEVMVKQSTLNKKRQLIEDTCSTERSVVYACMLYMCACVIENIRKHTTKKNINSNKTSL